MKSKPPLIVNSIILLIGSTVLGHVIKVAYYPFMSFFDLNFIVLASAGIGILTKNKWYNL